MIRNIFVLTVDFVCEPTQQEFISLKLGKTEKEKQNYIQEIIKSDMEEAGQEDVFRKIKKDLELGSVNLEEAEIRNEMEKALLRAKEDFK